MTDARDVLIEGFGRMPELVRGAVADLGREQLLTRPGGRGNSIGWLLWHLARVEDDHLAGATGGRQLWDEGWRDRFALPYAPDAIGYRMSERDVDAFDVPDVGLLVDYYDAVHGRTVESIRALGPDDFERVVDESWEPPVTMLVRLASVLNDVTQHVGQAAYVRGLLLRAA